MMIMRRFAVLAMAMVFGGCDDSGSSATAGASTTGPAGDSSDGSADGSSDDGATDVNEDDILERALAYKNFELVNIEPAQSEHALGDLVNVWVPAEYAEPYRAIDPAVDDTAAFEPGTLLIKEHLASDGDFMGTTLMFKGPPGYAPETGDWWWGRTTAAGALADSGQVRFCINCHQRVADSDFVFGVPASNQRR